MTLADGYGEVDFYLLPFVKPGYVRKLFDEEIKGYDMAVRRLIEREEIDPARRCVILSHQFYTAGGKEPATCDSEIHYVGGVENVDAGVLAPFDYAALGHIHRSQHIGAEKCRYCGTPFPYSVSEAGEEKSVTVVKLGEKGQPPAIRQIPLTPVREVKKLTGTLHEILEQAGEEVCHAFVSITLTDDVGGVPAEGASGGKIRPHPGDTDRQRADEEAVVGHGRAACRSAAGGGVCHVFLGDERERDDA